MELDGEGGEEEAEGKREQRRRRVLVREGE